MSLLATIKLSQLNARKQRLAGLSALLTTLIGEAEAIGKNSGNREPTDQEVTATLKKFIKNLDELSAVVAPESDHYVKAQAERKALELFLPKQLDEQELKQIVVSLVESLTIEGTKPKMGDVMKKLKQLHDGMYDGALASRLIKELT